MEHLQFEIPEDNEENLVHSLQDLYDRLRQNQSDLKCIVMQRFHMNYRNFNFTNERAIELGDALRDNTVVEKIFIDVAKMTLRGTGELAHYVATSSSLKEFHMIVGGEVQDINKRQVVAVVDRFLSAVSHHGNLRALQIPQIYGSIPLATALRANRGSLTQLNLSFRDFTTNISPGMKKEAKIVASTIGTLSKLESLDIKCQSDSCFTTAITLNLKNHPTLQDFVLELNDVGIDSVPIRAYILQTFFYTAKSLRSVVLKSNSLQNEFDDVLPMIVSGFHGHRSIQHLSLDFHTSRDNNATAVVFDLLRKKHGITDLSVRVDTLDGFFWIVWCLEENESLLSLDVTITNARKDDQFDVEAYNSEHKTFFACMKHLRSLNFFLESNSDNIPFPPEILHGLEANDCLTHVNFKWGDQNIDEELRLAKYYTARNYWYPKLLVAATKYELLNLFMQINRREKDEICLTIVYETLRRQRIFW